MEIHGMLYWKGAKPMIIVSSDFEAMVKSGLYVDKTGLICDLISLCGTGSSIIVNRPRRFGKSLSVSMIDAFFNADKPHLASLFDGLEVSKNADALRLMHSHPVIRLSFSDISDTKAFDPILYLKSAIADQYSLFENVVVSKLTKRESDEYESILNLSAPWNFYLSALKKLTGFIHRATEKKPIVLIDEYDLLVEKYINKDEVGCVSSLKTIYSALLKDNPHLSFGFLTGVFSLAKGTLGSGLNNIPADNGIAALFKDNYFGFSEADVLGLLKKASVPASELPRLAENYGGYVYYGKRYFNPWSILSFIAARVYTPFWAITARDTLFSSLLQTHDGEKTIAALIRGEEIYTQLDFSVSYEDLHSSINNAMIYLFLAGYVSIRQVDFSTFVVRIPNKEARNAFELEIAKRYQDKDGLDSLAKLKEAFQKGEEKEIELFLKSYLLSALSYYDLSNEKNYQIVIGTLAALLFGDSIVKFEVIEGEGRCDISISPKNEGGFGCVLEIKHYKDAISSARLENGALSALRQIKKNDYLEELKARKANPLFAYGFAFHKKKVAITKEKIV